MRRVINISLPPEIEKKVKERARKTGFASLSEYVRTLIKLESELISEDEILNMKKKAEKEYRAGKLKNYKSMQELLNE